MNHDETVDFFYRAIERFADWVKFADAKAAAVLLVLTLGVADLVGNARRLVDAHEVGNTGVYASVAFWAAAALAAITVALVALTFFPRVTARSGASLYFFGSVASHQSVQEFKSQVDKLDDDALTGQLAAQAWELARIAKAKVFAVQLATAAALAFLAAWAAARFLLGISA